MYKLPSSGKVRAVFFSLGIAPSKDPQLNCAQAICDLFAATKKTANVCIYALTEPFIIDSMIAAHNRGIKVQIVCDYTQSKGKAMQAAISRLQAAGIPVRIAQKQKACMHNKVGIFDGEIVATGSFNWTAGGSKKNDENLVILEGKEVAAAYQKYVFDRILEKETLTRT